MNIHTGKQFWNLGCISDLETCEEFISSFEQNNEIIHYELSADYKIKKVIEKIRVVVRKFRKTLTKNDDVLQK